MLGHTGQPSSFMAASTLSREAPDLTRVLYPLSQITFFCESLPNAWIEFPARFGSCPYIHAVIITSIARGKCFKGMSKISSNLRVTASEFAARSS